jgi:uncharacterized protein (TIGR02147 family)
MRGVRPLTLKNRLRLGTALGLPVQQIVPARWQISREQQKFQALPVDVFKSISDWHHDAILELTRVKDFESSPRWVAKKLRITVTEVNNAIERLQRLKMLEITKGGKWIDCSRNNTILPNFSDEGFTDLALRRLQKQLLEKSLDSVDMVPIEKRSHTSVTLAVDAEDLPEVKKKLREFRRELAAYLERKKARPDSVYQLCLSFFPLTETEQGELK